MLNSIRSAENPATTQYAAICPVLSTKLMRRTEHGRPPDIMQAALLSSQLSKSGPSKCAGRLLEVHAPRPPNTDYPIILVSLVEATFRHRQSTLTKRLWESCAKLLPLSSKRPGHGVSADQLADRMAAVGGYVV